MKKEIIALCFLTVLGVLGVSTLSLLSDNIDSANDMASKTISSQEFKKNFRERTRIKECENFIKNINEQIKYAASDGDRFIDVSSDGYICTAKGREMCKEYFCKAELESHIFYLKNKGI